VTGPSSKSPTKPSEPKIPDIGSLLPKLPGPETPAKKSDDSSPAKVAQNPPRDSKNDSPEPVPVDGQIPTKLLGELKAATVFIKMRTRTLSGSGSGFLIHVDGDNALIVTNDHVARPKVGNGPAQTAECEVIFRSGQSSEFKRKSELIAFDERHDFAVLQITGVRNLEGFPKPINVTDRPAISETTPIYIFGFPFGEELSMARGVNPAITISRGTITSLRDDKSGDTAAIQIDADANPGNSGGPVVDGRGRLVGVLRGGRPGTKINFAIPYVEVTRMVTGRVGDLVFRVIRTGKDAVTLEVRGNLIDPMGRVTSASVRVAWADDGASKPTVGENGEWPVMSGAKANDLAIAGKTVSANIEIPVRAGDRGPIEILCQPACVDRDGINHYFAPVSYRVRTTESAVVTNPPPGSPSSRAPEPGPAGPVPAGWKEFTPRDNAFTVWIPEKAQRQSERERTLTIRTSKLKMTQLTVELPGGLLYTVDRLVLPSEISTALKRSEIERIFHEKMLEEFGGKVTGERECKMGSIPGRELTVESGLKMGRIRLFVAGGGRVFILQVAGSAGDVEKPATDTFLNSCRIPTAPPKAPSPGPGPGPGVTGPRPGPGPAAPAGTATKIMGGTFDPEFKDAGPEGTLLAGLEIGLGKFFDNDVVRAVRPIFRKDGSDTLGTQHGTEIDRVVKAVAKPGYAIGAITVTAGLTVDGLSITFMKVVDGKLDPRDAYESEWIGGKGGGGPEKLTGNGTPVVGIVGKVNDKDVTGLGLLFKR
jgi:S1-C subfamily serine protease